MSSLTGQSLGHYEIGEKVGAGGMGEVYRARDTRLGRDVALKVLPEAVASDPQRLARFRREAQAVASLSHPRIVVVHSVEEDRGQHFITMELVQGARLDERIPEGGLPVDEALDISIGLAEALAAAHAKGIVHRDLKPSNVMVAPDGRVKVLDFGLAALTEVAPGADDDETATALTREGTVVGTAPYMSPEQAAGRPIDVRSDLFSLGAVMHELLTGKRAFDGESHTEILASVLRETPPPVGALRPEAPRDLAAIVERCLAKSPEERFASGTEVHERLAALRSTPRGSKQRPLVIVAAVAVVLIAALLAGRSWWNQRRLDWVRNEAVPAAIARADSHDFVGALGLARRAAEVAPDDPQVTSLLLEVSVPAAIATTPPGATVAYRAYRDVDGPWEEIGTTPIADLRVADGYLAFRVEKPGFAPLVRAAGARRELAWEMTPADETPDGMVRVPGGMARFGVEEPVELEPFWIDRYEVTNADYQAFVDAGGYEHEALAGYHDRTGRPGPAAWELGTYPEGAADHPVSGVSWYEAAAYAAFVGKQLPTVYHWYQAAGQGVFSDILVLSNLGGVASAPAPVGEYRGIGPYGTYDMAGNVREWAHNETGSLRYMLGGSFGDPPYVHRDGTALDPGDRSAENGIRLVLSENPPPERALEPVVDRSLDFNDVEPVDDATFELYRSLFAYDPQQLQPRIESVNDDHPDWTHETVTFDAAYGGERVLAHLFLPKNASPPYQTILFFPHSGAREMTSSRDLLTGTPVKFIPRTGRALMYPVYRGTFERGGGNPAPSGYERRDQIVSWARDVSRAIDYLETRDDIDTARLGFMGISLGAEYGPIFTALDDRFSASALVSGHLHAHQMRDPVEIQPVHFAPRSTVPVIMVNGRDDFTSPVESCLEPMLELQGAPTADKRLVLLDGGHILPGNEVTGYLLDWFDRYLGSVERKRPE